MLIETREYSNIVKKQWQQNRVNALKLIEELSGLKLPTRTIQVYLTHPKLKNGLTLDDDTITWGHHEDWKNYSTVYLCHEIMHILTEHDDSDEAHAVIELMIDNELRIRLNNQGKYFEYLGHTRLEKLERSILQPWKNYLKKRDKNILKFISSLKNRNAASSY